MKHVPDEAISYEVIGSRDFGNVLTGHEAWTLFACPVCLRVYLFDYENCIVFWDGTDLSANTRATRPPMLACPGCSTAIEPDLTRTADSGNSPIAVTWDALANSHWNWILKPGIRRMASQWTRLEIENAIEHAHVDEVVYLPDVIVESGYECEWALSACLKLLEHTHTTTKIMALRAICSLVHDCDAPPRDIVMPLLRQHCKSADKEVRDLAFEASRLIEEQTGWKHVW